MAQLSAGTSGFSLPPGVGRSTNLGWPWAREAKKLARPSSAFIHTCAPDIFFGCPSQTLFGPVGKSLASWVEPVTHLGAAKRTDGEGGRD